MADKHTSKNIDSSTDSEIDPQHKLLPNLWFGNIDTGNKDVAKLKRIISARMNLLARRWHSKIVCDESDTMQCVLDKKSGRRVCYQLTNAQKRLGYVLTLCLNAFSSGLEGELISTMYVYEDEEVLPTPTNSVVLMNARNQAQVFVDNIEEFFIKHRHAIRVYNEVLAEAKRSLPQPVRI